MKWTRFRFQGKVCSGYLQEDVLHVIKGDVYSGKWQETGETVFLNDVELLAPCLPSKIVCVGLNYRDHAAEMKMELPQEPIMFMKPPSAVVAPNQPIVLPDWIGRIDYEAELVVVMGKTAKNIPAAQAKEYIFGYTCGNDVTGRHLQKTDGQWTRAKSFDTFCPLGPWIVTEVDPSDLEISLELNGELRQQSRTSQLVFDPHKLVELISRVMTLEPGDVIMTGTPAGVGPLTQGDSVMVKIEQIGELTNPVASE